jgi:hypothetical protein
MGVIFQHSFLCFAHWNISLRNNQQWIWGCIFGVLGLIRFQSILNNILTVDITLIQCKNNPIIMTKFESIVFYQAPFCLQAHN